MHPKDPNFPIKFKYSWSLWELTKPIGLVIFSTPKSIQGHSTSFRSSKPAISSHLKNPLSSSPSNKPRNFSTSENPWKSVDFYEYRISQPRSLTSQLQYQKSSKFDPQQQPLQ
ncbi:hypothetical protein AYI69_g7896 [Smittium culicis]|uniref:Uncharacterized protein n=1 Tax=Smittium culicis TaxID=133412 RepID=A0A1R1XNP8_9FUNG|nr:hypothetical protein AYI69_g7896 [Smittium culicis]